VGNRSNHSDVQLTGLARSKIWKIGLVLTDSKKNDKAI
jgi:hypothetical protein